MEQHRRVRPLKKEHGSRQTGYELQAITSCETGMAEWSVAEIRRNAEKSRERKVSHVRLVNASSKEVHRPR